MLRLNWKESNELEKICVICEICVKKLVKEIPLESSLHHIGTFKGDFSLMFHDF